MVHGDQDAFNRPDCERELLSDLGGLFPLAGGRADLSDLLPPFEVQPGRAPNTQAG
jgi:hypothetical protein